MQHTTYISPLPLLIFFSGERSTFVNVKHKSSHQIFHFCGLVVEFVQCSVSCYSTWGSFGSTFVSFFSIFGLAIRKNYPLRIEYFLVFEFHSKPSRAQNRAALVLITDTVILQLFSERFQSFIQFELLVFGTVDRRSYQSEINTSIQRVLMGLCSVQKSSEKEFGTCFLKRE